LHVIRYRRFRFVEKENHMKSLSLFCGSSSGFNPEYTQAAQAFAKAMLARNMRLVYGGADVGIMGTLANAYIENGGEVIGVIPKFLEDVDIAHTGLSTLHVTETMHQRKAKIAELCDGFVVLPGGLGSLEELFEAWTWLQLGIQVKPVGMLNVNGFFDKLLSFLDHAVTEGFLKKQQRDLLVVHDNPDALLDALGEAQLDVVPKWVGLAKA
jgi:uncharacterized protein (TIGR00730 family)